MEGSGTSLPVERRSPKVVPTHMRIFQTQELPACPQTSLAYVASRQTGQGETVSGRTAPISDLIRSCSNSVKSFAMTMMMGEQGMRGDLGRERADQAAWKLRRGQGSPVHLGQRG